MPSDNRPKIILLLRCSNCGMVHSRTESMLFVDAKRMWDDLVYQKDLINNSPFNLCCNEPLDYYIGSKLAREVLFQKGEK